MNSKSKHICIVGAGLGGALLACYLAKMGHRVGVYERRSDPRRQGYSGGRSINLALSARGLKGLAGVGLAETILREAIPMRGRLMHPIVGATAYQAYSKDKTDAINSISRSGLNIALLDAAEKLPGVTLHFDHRCLDVDLEGPSATFEHVLEAGGAAGPLGGESAKPRVQIVAVQADLIIGTDGAYSAVRARMQKQERFDYSQAYLEHGYKELHIPPLMSVDPKTGEPRTEHALDPHALHIWPRGSSMMIALPNIDKSFTATLFWPYDGRHSFGSLKTGEQVERFFNEQYPDAVPLMPTLREDFLTNPVGSLVTVKCRPWVYKGKAALLGDAAHAIVPFFGQGMNCAFEDCLELAACLKEFGGDTERALREYESRRRENADAIAQMALDNFIEMRDKVASRAFRFKKRVEHALHAIFPKRFMPLYHMVSFTTIPYAEALARGRQQARLLQGLGLAAMTLAGAGLALALLTATGIL